VSGILIVGTIGRKHQFTEHEIDLCSTISILASLSLENSILFKKLNKNVRNLRKAVDEKNIVTEALKESEERFHTMFEKHHAVMMLIEPESGKIIDANKSAEDFYGYSINELRNLNIANINQLSKSELKKALDTAARESKTYFNFPHKLKSGEVKYVEVFTTPITVKDITLLFSIVHDITDRKIAEEEVLRSQEQLRALAARLEKIREDERINLSRELHDNLGQSLTGLKMDVAWLARKISSKKKEKTENFLTKTASMSELIDQIINDVRRISTDLRPNLLDYLGLQAALEWLVNDFSKRTEIDCVFNSKAKNIKLDVSLSNSIYRIIQEALTNIARHSGATKVELDIVQNNNQINFVIKDNGKGITKAEINNVQSLGLRGMQERSFQINGELSIVGKKDKGTTVTLSIPKEN
jgi:PAS domain S-box-containing protein